MNNGYIAQSQNISVKIRPGYASLVPRLSCAGGEPWNEATAMPDQLVTVNTQNTDKLI